MRPSELFAGQLLEMADFVWRLQVVQAEAPYSVTSWWRTRERNAQVGGAARSLHLRGLAVDLLPGVGVSREALAASAEKSGLHALVEKDHVHVQARPLKVG